MRTTRRSRLALAAVGWAAAPAMFNLEDLP
jgi:hypothetical protein